MSVKICDNGSILPNRFITMKNNVNLVQFDSQKEKGKPCIMTHNSCLLYIGVNGHGYHGHGYQLINKCKTN